MRECQFRYRCDACHESGDWYDGPDAAEQAADEHCENEHDETLLYPTRIQRFPVEEIEAGEVR